VSKKTDIPKATVTRLSKYLRFLEYENERGRETISSREIGERLQYTDTQVRKDLTYFGQFGSPGVGYHVEELIGEIRKILGTDRKWQVAVVGIGNLGRALAANKSFLQKGFEVVALFDNAPDIIGMEIAGMTVQNIDTFSDYIRENEISLAVIAVPAAEAQKVVDLMVKAEIKGFLNFAPIHPAAPEGVFFVTVDLAVLFEQLTFRIGHSSG
jgi:redox-sensing transcriptional repressor